MKQLYRSLHLRRSLGLAFKANPLGVCLSWFKTLSPKRAMLLVITFFIVASVVTTSGIAAFLPQTASAAPAPEAPVGTKWEDRKVEDQVKIYQTFIAAMSCIAESKLRDNGFGLDLYSRINVDNASKYQWYSEPNGAKAYDYTYLGDNLLNAKPTTFGPITLAGGSMFPCGVPSALQAMLKIMGEDTSVSGGLLACTLGFDRNVAGGGDGAGGGCKNIPNAQGDFYRTSSQVKDVAARWSARFWGGKKPYLTPAAEYYRYLSLFDIAHNGVCAKKSDDPTLTGTDRSYEIYTVSEDPATLGVLSTAKTLFYGADGTGRQRSDAIAIGGGIGEVPNGVLLVLGGFFTALQSQLTTSVTNLIIGPHQTTMTCADLEAKLNDQTLAAQYANYVKQNGAPTNNGAATAAQCAADPTATGCDNGTAAKPTCNIEAIGWIVCPSLKFVGSITDGAFNFLATSFLATDTALVDTNSTTYSAWAVMRSIANIAFVVVFLIIIFSQITSIGISNYGLKKMLPRLIIAAILVNVSFYVCQIAVDLSNILGYSLKGVFDGLLPAGALTTTDGAASSGDASGNGFGIAAIVTTILAAGVVSYFAIAILIPILLGALVAILMIVLMLIFRKAAIVLLIIVAPLAFVAFLLPNTSSLFEKWRKALIALLMLFPIIAIVFGASNLAAEIIRGSAIATGDNLMSVISIGVAMLPLFVVPGLLKGSLNALGSVGAKLNGFAAKAGGGLGKAYTGSEFNKFRAGKKAEASAYTRAGSYEGKNPFRRVASAVNKRINATGGDGTYRASRAGSGARYEAEAVRKEVEKLESGQGGVPVDPKSNYENLMRSADLDPKSNPNGAREQSIKRRAAHNYLLKSYGAGGRDIIDAENARRAGGAAAAATPTAGASAAAGGGGPAPAGGGGGNYRINSAGQAIRPSGTSGNDGAYISSNEQGAIDSRQGALDASQAAEADALARGHSAEDAQAIGAAEYRLHDR